MTLVGSGERKKKPLKWIKKNPNLNKEISIKDFKDFYWLKSELISFCREIGLSSSDGKIEIANRISKYLETGTITKKATTKKPKLPKATQPITNGTVIGIDSFGASAPYQELYKNFGITAEAIVDSALKLI